MFYAYILQSEKDGTHYYGSCQDVSKRLLEHNAGKVRHTKGHLPYKVQYVEEFETRSDAVQRERFFKTVDGYRWLKEQGIL